MVVNFLGKSIILLALAANCRLVEDRTEMEAVYETLAEGREYADEPAINFSEIHQWGRAASLDQFEHILFRNTANSHYEEFWMVFRAADGEVTWYEAGIEQTGEMVLPHLEFLVGLLRDNIDEQTEILFYHNHPREESGRFNAPSYQDLNQLIQFDVRRHDFLGMEGSNPMSSRVVVREGIYTIRLDAETLEELGERIFINNFRVEYPFSRYHDIYSNKSRYSAENLEERISQFCELLSSSYLTITFRSSF